MQTCLYTCGVVVLLSPNVCIVLFPELFFFFFVRPHLFVGPVFYFYFFCFVSPPGFCCGSLGHFFVAFHESADEV